MDTFKNTSYDDFLKTIIRRNFLPMYGCNLENPRTKRMDDEYHISVNLDRGLFLTSESHNDVLHESRLYYELNVSKSGQDSATIDRILDLLKVSDHTSCCNTSDKSTFAMVYDAQNDLMSHLDMLTDKGIYTNNPWMHLDKHVLRIINIDEDRIRLQEYHKNYAWIDWLPKEARYMIGYR